MKKILFRMKMNGKSMRMSIVYGMNGFTFADLSFLHIHD